MGPIADPAASGCDALARLRIMTGIGPIAVLGGGAWGTALANAAAAAAERPVVLWMRDAGSAADMARTRENARHLPGVSLHRGCAPPRPPRTSARPRLCWW